MKISIGADHAGFEMKERVKTYLVSRGHDVQDIGTYSTESTDYPPYEIGRAHV
jgi:ribose 5-phosphate isomerase B